MNPKPSNLVLVCLAAASFQVAAVPAGAQEEQLQMALEMQDKRIAGLNRLADKIKNFGFLSRSKEVVTKLDDRERKQDPFGMAMDPEEELPEVVAEEIIDETGMEEAPGTTLQEALSKFHVTGIFPKTKEVMVGAQNLGVGDTVVIDYKGVTFNLNIEDVTQNEISVKDLDTGEIASVNLGFNNALPPGMSRRQPEVTEEDASRKSATIVPMSERVVKVE